MLVSCFDDEGETNDLPGIQRLGGDAVGSYYRVTYVGNRLAGLQTSIDSLLDAYNLELSPWVNDSRINAFNRSDTGISLEGTVHFTPNLQLAERVTRATAGAYDPTAARGRTGLMRCPVTATPA